MTTDMADMIATLLVTGVPFGAALGLICKIFGWGLQKVFRVIKDLLKF